MPPELATIVARVARTDGLHLSPVPGVHVVRYAHTDRRTKRQWRACLAIVVQGCKEVSLGRRTHRCAEGAYTAAPVPLAVTSRIAVATPDRPFLGLLIDLDPLVVGEISAQMASRRDDSPAAASRALFSGPVDDDMRDAAMRLARTFETPDRARVVGPLIVRELCYDLLRGPEGAAIRRFVSAGTAMHRIATAAFAIRTNLDDAIDVGELAAASGMSRSAFFQHFRDALAMSPIQYQKRLRLLEARRLMVDGEETAERAALAVGYRSASQFSREYLRLFGVSPRRDAVALRRAVSFHAGAP